MAKQTLVDPGLVPQPTRLASIGAQAFSPYVNGPGRESGGEGAPEQWIVSRGFHGPETRVRALVRFRRNLHETMWHDPPTFRGSYLRQ